MIAEVLVVVSFATTPAPVEVYTDSVPAHWRNWPVKTVASLDRTERCQYRVDASRVLRNRPVTQGVPRKCMPRWMRAISPDRAK